MDYTQPLNTIAACIQFALVLFGAVGGALLVKALW